MSERSGLSSTLLEPIARSRCLTCGPLQRSPQTAEAGCPSHSSLYEEQPATSTCLCSRLDCSLRRFVDFDFASLRSCLSDWNLHFQDAVHEGRIRLVRRCPFRQRNLPIEPAISPLAAEEALALLFFFFLSLARDSQHLIGEFDFYVILGETWEIGLDHQVAILLKHFNLRHPVEVLELGAEWQRLFVEEIGKTKPAEIVKQTLHVFSEAAHHAEGIKFRGLSRQLQLFFCLFLFVLHFLLLS